MATKKRFAALIRVSTEKQEKQGESLRTQRKQNEDTVKKLSGKIVGWYGGQEHATAGYEKREIERLLNDARQGRFDAVIVANADRWSRDNEYSQQGLAVLKEKRIEFYTGATRWDLFTPSHKLFLGMSAEIGAFFASNQKLSSIQNRIERAKRGIPTGGKKPFGRNFVDGKWVIDKEKQAMIKDVAKRYLNSLA